MRRRSRLVKIPASGGGGGGGGGATYDTPTRYASPTGTEPWATATDVDHPCSAATAFGSATAGHVVQFAAGTYTGTAGNDRFIPAFRPTNSGSAGNYITFQGNHAGTVVLAHTGGSGPLLGVNGPDYIVLRGFRCDEANGISAVDTGPVTINNYSHHIIIEDCEIDGNGNPNSVGTNHPGIRLEGATDITLRYNWIHDCYNTVGPHGDGNASGVQCYESGRVEIYSNDIITCGGGVFLKNLVDPGSGSIDWFLIHHNWVEDVCIGFYHGRTPMIESAPAKYYQNVVKLAAGYGASYATQFNVLIDYTKYGLVVNNTFVGTNTGNGGVAVLSATTGNKIWNNIFYDMDLYFVNANSSSYIDPAVVDFEHNCYYLGDDQFYIGSTTYSLATWKSTYTQDSASPAAHSSNPTFVDFANDNYKLDTGSPCLDAGIDTLNLLGGGTTEPINQGAYITGDETIGRP